jgi:hypothetical protein
MEGLGVWTVLFVFVLFVLVLLERVHIFMESILENYKLYSSSCRFSNVQFRIL